MCPICRFDFTEELGNMVKLTDDEMEKLLVAEIENEKEVRNRHKVMRDSENLLLKSQKKDLTNKIEMNI